MVILGIETSAAVGSVAILKDGSTAAERTFTAGLVHGVELMPAIDSIVGQAREIDLIAVSRGPGSYTGVRVGVTAAKTLAYSLDRPVVGVVSLDAIATNAPEEFQTVHAVVDARRERVYIRSYKRAGATLEPAGPVEAIAVARAVERISPGDAALGDALGKYREAFGATAGQLCSENTWQPTAANVCRIGQALFEKNGSDDIHGLVPLYLHRPEAEEVWERRQREQGKALGGN